MLVYNQTNNHAFLIGEALSVKDDAEYFLIRLKHKVYDSVTRTSHEIVTGIFVRDIEENPMTGRPAIPYAGRARNMRVAAGSHIGVYVRFTGDGMKTANGYSISYDGLASFTGLNNKTGNPEKFSIVMGAVKSLTERADKNGEGYVQAHVYIGKRPIRDMNHQIVYDINGFPQYEYRYVDVNGRKSQADRFRKALQRGNDGSEKNVAFLCGGEPYSFIGNDGAERAIYTSLNFELMGFVRK